MKKSVYTTKDKIKDAIGIILIIFLLWLFMMFINIIEPMTDDNMYGNPPEDVIQFNLQKERNNGNNK